MKVEEVMGGYQGREGGLMRFSHAGGVGELR